MRSEHRRIDLNAYIDELKCEIKSIDEKKQLQISFRNVSQSIITGVKLKSVCFDSFGDIIDFNGNNYLEIKKQQ